MSWLDLSLILPFFSSAFSLSSKVLLKDVQPTSYTAYVLLLSGLMIVAYNLLTGKKMKLNAWAVISGFAFGLATFGFETAVSKAKNPGMVNAIYRTQTVLTAILSVFLLGSHLSPLSITGIIIALLGAVTIALDHNSIEHFTSDEIKENKYDYEWIKWAVGAGLLLTVKDITAVKSLRSGMTPYSYAMAQLLFGALIMFGYKYYKENNFKLNLDKRANVWSTLSGMGFVATDNVLWCLLLVYLMGKAPNPAYPKAITLISVVLTAFLSKFFFPEAALDLQQWAGIFMVLGGIGTMVFANVI